VPSSSRFDNDVNDEADDASFVPEDSRDYSTAPRLPLPPGPHAFILLSNRMDGSYAIDRAEDAHEEAVADWPHTYTYLRHHEYPQPSRSDGLAVARDNEENDLFRQFLTDVVALLPVQEEDRQALVFNVLVKLHQIGIYTIRECLQDLIMINPRLIRINRSPLFHHTLNMIAQRAVEVLVPDPSIAPQPPRSSSSDKAYHFNLTTEERAPSATVKKAIPKWIS
jgi:hypothetical protein